MEPRPPTKADPSYKFGQYSAEASVGRLKIGAEPAN